MALSFFIFIFIFSVKLEVFGQDENLVPYKLGGITIMVDPSSIGLNSPLMSHLIQGMPSRIGQSNDKFLVETSEENNNPIYGQDSSHEQGIGSTNYGTNIKDSPMQSSSNFDNTYDKEISTYNFNHDAHDNERGGVDGISDSSKLHHNNYGTDFVKSNNGKLAISINPLSPIPMEGAGGVYLQDEHLQHTNGQNTNPDLYYSPKIPSIDNVSQKIHNIVSDLNKHSGVSQHNDRAPIQTSQHRYPLIPPIPNAEPIDPEMFILDPRPLQPAVQPLSFENTDGFAGVMYNPNESSNFDSAFSDKSDSTTTWVELNPIPVINFQKNQRNSSTIIKNNETENGSADPNEASNELLIDTILISKEQDILDGIKDFQENLRIQEEAQQDLNEAMGTILGTLFKNDIIKNGKPSPSKDEEQEITVNQYYFNDNYAGENNEHQNVPEIYDVADIPEIFRNKDALEEHFSSLEDNERPVFILPSNINSELDLSNIKSVSRPTLLSNFPLSREDPNSSSSLHSSLGPSFSNPNRPIPNRPINNNLQHGRPSIPGHRPTIKPGKSTFSNFPLSREDPNSPVLLKDSNPHTSSVLYYSHTPEYPLSPIVGAEASGVYINGEKVFNRHLGEDPSSLHSWFDVDPIKIFDPSFNNDDNTRLSISGPSSDSSSSLHSSLGPSFSNPNRPIPNRPINNNIQHGQPSIPGHRPTIKPGKSTFSVRSNDTGCSANCLRIRIPVCGSDGQTYNNLCMLQLAACEGYDVTLEHDGECTVTNETSGSDTDSCPSECQRDFNPVCGSDGSTYNNKCMLEVAACEGVAVNMLYKGKCDNRSVTTTTTTPSPGEEVIASTTVFEGAVFHSATPSLLRKSSCRCGLRFNNKIVGGESVGIESFPWQVGITISRTDFTYCAGSIISDKFILTAAHCVENKEPADIHIRLGETTRYGPTETAKIKTFHKNRDNSYEIISHHDIALIELKKRISFSAEKMPICLPLQSNKELRNTKAIVTGWGRVEYNGVLADSLQQVEVDVLTTRQCEKKSKYKDSKIHRQIICASSKNKDACQGDSGGPLVRQIDDHYQQIGIVSWGIKCAEKKYPGIYTKVSAYSDWINDIIDENGESCRDLNKDKKDPKKKKDKKKKKNKKNKEKNKKDSNKNRKRPNKNKINKKNNKKTKYEESILSPIADIILKETASNDGGALGNVGGGGNDTGAGSSSCEYWCKNPQNQYYCCPAPGQIENTSSEEIAQNDDNNSDKPTKKKDKKNKKDKKHKEKNRKDSNKNRKRPNKKKMDKNKNKKKKNNKDSILSAIADITLTASNDSIGSKCKSNCQRERIPVCGSNGKTYNNRCMLELEACEGVDVSLAFHGECENTSSEEQGQNGDENSDKTTKKKNKDKIGKPQINKKQETSLATPEKEEEEIDWSNLKQAIKAIAASVDSQS